MYSGENITSYSYTIENVSDLEAFKGPTVISALSKINITKSPLEEAKVSGKDSAWVSSQNPGVSFQSKSKHRGGKSSLSLTIVLSPEAYMDLCIGHDYPIPTRNLSPDQLAIYKEKLKAAKASGGEQHR